jgi:MFS family permease
MTARDPGKTLRTLPGLPQLGLSHDNKRMFWALACSEGATSLFLTMWAIYVAELGASAPQVGLVLGSRSFGALVFLLLSGPLSDRIPARRYIIGCRSLFVVGMLLISLAWTWWMVIPAALFVSAATMAWPVVSRTIAEQTEDGPERLRAFTLIYTVGPSIAMLAGPALSGVIADRVDLRAVFWAAAAVGVVSIAILATIHPSERAGDESVPASYRRLLAETGIWRLYLLSMGAMFVFSLGHTLTPVYLQEVHELALGRIGLLGSVAAAGSIGFGLVAARVAFFRQALPVLLLALGCVALSFAVLAAGRGYWQFAVAFLLEGGFYLIWPLLYTRVSDAAPERLRSRAYALVEVTFFISFTIAPIVAGALYKIQPRLPLMLGAALVLPVAIAGARVFRTTTVQPTPLSTTLVEAPPHEAIVPGATEGSTIAARDN